MVRSSHAPLISLHLCIYLFIPLSLSPPQVVILLGFFFALQAGSLDGTVVLPTTSYHHTDVVRSLVFNSFVMCQVFNQLNCRKVEDELNILGGILKARMFIAITVLTIIFQICFITFIPPAITKTVPLTLQQWLICIAIGAATIPLSTISRIIPLESASGCCGGAPKGLVHDGDSEAGDPERERLLGELAIAKAALSAAVRFPSYSTGGSPKTVRLDDGDYVDAEMTATVGQTEL